MLALHIIASLPNLHPHIQKCKRIDNSPEVMSWLIPRTEITAPAMPLLFSSDTIPLMPW